MPVRGYEFYLRGLNSIYRVEHEKIEFVSTSGFSEYAFALREEVGDASRGASRRLLDRFSPF